MLRTVVSFLSLTLLILPSQTSSPSRNSAANFIIVRQCVADEDLTKAITSLSGQYPEAQAAQRSLRRLANHSSECRKRIIAAVMKAMDKPNLDLRQDQASANLWREGARLLGDLKATQSLDLLLSHIKITDGEWSVSMVHQPALGGIIQMGPLAIPRLKPLLRSEDWETRQYAVYCLFWIGGTSARRALEKTLGTETHSCVKRFISASLTRMRPVKKTMRGADDQSEWVSSFMCVTWTTGN